MARKAVQTLADRTKTLTTDSIEETGSEADLMTRLLEPQVKFGEPEAASMVARVTAHNARQMGQSLGVKIPELSTRRSLALARQTVKTILSIAGIVARALAPLIGRSVREGLRGEAFAAEVAKRLKVSEKQAERIAVGQVIRVNSTITQDRHKLLGIVEYKWRAVPDSNTRDWHRKLDGTVQRYDAPPLGGGGGPKDRGHPGSADVCRCQAIPVIPKRKR
jgi:SPP1 gp7 family putative phage head morphogenesis protein